jgi:hypothetical protein
MLLHLELGRGLLYSPSCRVEVFPETKLPALPIEGMFEDIEQADTIDCEYCMPDEDNLPIYVVRSPKVFLQEICPQVKHYN